MTNIVDAHSAEILILTFTGDGSKVIGAVIAMLDGVLIGVLIGAPARVVDGLEPSVCRAPRA